MRRLVHLVINAVRYATSLPAPWTVVGPERRSLSKRIGQLGGKRIKRDAAPPKLGHTRSGESLFLLPGKITISRLRELQACERGAGAEVFSPFMVRGHWRRPPATWKDQLLRWIEPYWKGQRWERSSSASTECRTRQGSRAQTEWTHSMTTSASTVITSSSPMSSGSPSTLIPLCDGSGAPARRT